MALWSIDRILGTEQAPVQRAQPKAQPRSFSRADKGKGRTIPSPSTKTVLADVMNGFPHSSTDRFLSPYRKEELDHLCRPFIPDRTQSNNNWATHVYKMWVAARNQMNPDDILPADLFEVWYPLDIQDRTLQHLSWRSDELTVTITSPRVAPSRTSLQHFLGYESEPGSGKCC